MKRLFMWGTGQDAHKLIERNRFLLLFVEGFIDSNREGDCQEFYGKKVYVKEEIEWNADNYVIVSTRKYYDEIALYLETKSLLSTKDYTRFESAYMWNMLIFSLKQRQRFDIFISTASDFSKWIPDIEEKISKNGSSFVQYVVNGNVSCERALLSCCCDEETKTLQFVDGGVIEYDNIRDLTTIIKEILIEENYFFHANTRTPYIIDGGANIGLAIYYFKHIYPQAHIIAFEPNPKLYQILQSNISRNNWTNVKVYPYALSDSQNEEMVFYIQRSGLAGSLEKRNLEAMEDKAAEIRVPTVCLSDYISRNVDYLKLDIEGSETKVIEEIEEKLSHVFHIFIEFHEGQLKGYNSISKIISLLEEKGFDVNITKVLSSNKKINYQPMEKVGKRVSEIIWAKYKFIPSFECTYYCKLGLLRINASILNCAVDCCEVYVGEQSLGKITQNIFVNDENTLQGSPRWNSFFVKVIKDFNFETLQIKMKWKDIIYPVVVCDVIRTNSIPRCYTSMTGTKEGLVVNTSKEQEFLAKWSNKKANNNLTLLAIECSSVCNCRCKYCLVGQDYTAIERSTLSDEVRREAINLINRFPSIEVVQLNGLGEPLLYEGIADLCQELYEKTHVHRVKFFTNGLLLTQEIVDRLIGIPLKYKITISIDGSNPEENNVLRVGSEYKKIKQNLTYLLEKTVGNINFIISIHNLQLSGADECEIPEFLLDDFGNIAIDSHKTFYFPKLSKEKMEKEGILYHEKINKRLCKRCFSQATIRSNGDVIVCHWDSGCNLVMGNILKTPFEKIWNGEKYNMIRQLMHPNVPIEQLPNVCRNCHAMNEGFLYKKC